MRLTASFQTTRLVCLLIAATWTAGPSRAKADDTTGATAPVTVTAPETTNPPVTVTAPAATNQPATATESATTNTPAATNTPPPASAPLATNEAASAIAPVATNQPTITNQPTTAPVPTPAATPTNVTMTPAPATPVMVMPPTIAVPLSRRSLPYQPLSVGAEAGTTGYGGVAAWRFADHLGIRAGLDYFQYSFSVKFEDAKYDFKIHLMSEPVALDLFPSRNSTFHVSLGALINQNKFTGGNGSAENITINGTTYVVPANALSLKLNQPSALPYASLGGSVYLDRRHRWSFGGELGAAYGRWDASFKDSSGTISAADIADEQKKVRNAANKVPVWPIIKVSIGYSF